MTTPAGWYPNPENENEERYWSGDTWAEHTRARSSTPLMSAERRKQQLAQVVAQHVAAGSRVESQTDYQAILVTGKNVNHLLHFLIGLFTCGAWWLVWLILAFATGEKRHVIAVDEYGYIQRR